MNIVPSHCRWTRRQALWFMAGAVGSIGLQACAQSARTSRAANSANLIPVSIGITPWIGCAPLYVAQEKGFFQEAGLRLSLKNFSASAEGTPAFSAGQLQGMQITSPDAVSLAAKGTDYRIVGVMDSSNGADAFLARNSVGSIADFKGKQVAVQKGGVGHFFLLQILEEAGLSEDDIRIIDIDAETASSAYQAGNLEIAYSFSPFLEQADAAQKDGRIIYDSSKQPTAILDLYIVNTDFAERQPQAVQAFLSGTFKGLEFLNTQRQEALAIVGKYLEITPEEVSAQLRGVSLPDLKTNLEMLGNPQSPLYVLESMNAMAEFLQAQEQIESIPDMAQTIDLQFLQALNTTT